jgi:hypothetical protein
MRARVTADDLRSGMLVNPGHYLVRVTDYNEKPGRSDPKSTTAHIELKAICDAEGDETFKGARCMVFINEKGMNIAPNPQFLVALGAKVDPKTGIDANVDKSIMGRVVECYLARGQYDGKDQNQAADFSPLGTNIRMEIVQKHVPTVVAK